MVKTLLFLVLFCFFLSQWRETKQIIIFIYIIPTKKKKNNHNNKWFDEHDDSLTFSRALQLYIIF